MVTDLGTQIGAETKGRKRSSQGSGNREDEES